jgi:hypothetical protein
MIDWDKIIEGEDIHSRPEHEVDYRAKRKKMKQEDETNGIIVRVNERV